MSELFNTPAPTTPSLTLDPLGAEQPAAPAAPAPVAKPEEAALEIVLTEQEQKIVEDFIPKIELRDSATITQYGAGAQKKIADFSENILGSVRTKDLGEVGEMLAGVVTELKSFDVEEEKGLFGFFKRSSNRITAIRAKYDHAESNVTKIAEALETHQVTLMKDIALLDKMYEMNVAYFRELCMYIIAGKRKLQQVR